MERMTYTMRSIVSIEDYQIMKTDASIRRFIAQQRHKSSDEMLRLFDRYEIYVWCVAQDSFPKTFKQWLED
jgi:hypothetical protein